MFIGNLIAQRQESVFNKKQTDSVFLSFIFLGTNHGNKLFFCVFSDCLQMFCHLADRIPAVCLLALLNYLFCLAFCLIIFYVALSFSTSLDPLNRILIIWFSQISVSWTLHCFQRRRLTIFVIFLLTFAKKCSRILSKVSGTNLNIFGLVFLLCPLTKHSHLLSYWVMELLSHLLSWLL